MRLFYSNGGGVCYIVSIGDYSAAVTSDADFVTGLNLLRKFDEPTLLLFPDAINLTVEKLGLVQQQALLQCADLMDRFTVMDVKQESDLVTDSATFRDRVGNQNLKYGAAYYPYVKSAFPYTYRFSDINGITPGKVNFKGIFSTNTTVKNNIEEFEKELKLNNEVYGNETFERLLTAIKIEDLSFSFNQKDFVLKDINIEIKKNQCIAFVGESGSGKTTLVNLICGLLKPTDGNIVINENSIFNYDLRQYQNRIGYISQEPVIFNDTIFNNVTFWDSKSEENCKKFEEALKKASISDFVNSLSEKEETILGNNGVNLSGGQKQRISIAREIYKEIDILVLDEATSALDSDNEKLIQENIEAMQGDLTIIIIAHRLSTIRNVDTIYLLEKGQVTNSGNFAELVNSSERFKKMVELQEI